MTPTFTFIGMVQQDPATGISVTRGIKAATRRGSGKQGEGGRATKTGQMKAGGLGRLIS